MKEEVYGIWLSQTPGLGTNSAYKLWNRYQSFERIFNLSEAELFDCLSTEAYTHLRVKRDELKEHKEKINEVEKYYNKVVQRGIEVIIPSHALFPQSLKDLSDCPTVLYAKGNLNFPTLGIGIVGARRCSDYGKKVAIHFAKELGEAGVNIISGLAYGIDISAHKGALLGGGFTTAVLGGGLHECYPAKHLAQFNQISQTGCLLSEEPYGKETLPYMFPKRNRIISGLSQGVLVIEAAQKSGSLITVDFALEQGKEVFTIPGRLFDTFAEGTNNLIKQGAKTVFQIDDILSEFTHILAPKVKLTKKNEKNLEEMEKIVYSCISYDPQHQEAIKTQIVCLVEQLNDGVESKLQREIKETDIYMSLLTLEMKGLIIKKSGCYYARSEV